MQNWAIEIEIPGIPGKSQVAGHPHSCDHGQTGEG